MDTRKYWEDVWDKKGKLEGDNLVIIDGYDNTGVTPEQMSKLIIKDMNIKSTDKVLEVGCGAGGLGQYLSPICEYYGCDYSESMINKHLELFKHQVMVCEANDLQYKTKYFDKVFCFSCFQYFPTLFYAYQSLAEMIRVSRKGVYVYDLPIKSHRKEHLLFDKKYFQKNKWNITKGFYNPNRFNVKKEFYG